VSARISEANVELSRVMTRSRQLEAQLMEAQARAEVGNVGTTPSDVIARLRQRLAALEAKAVDTSESQKFVSRDKKETHPSESATTEFTSEAVKKVEEQLERRQQSNVADEIQLALPVMEDISVTKAGCQESRTCSEAQARTNVKPTARDSQTSIAEPDDQGSSATAEVESEATTLLANDGEEKFPSTHQLAAGESPADEAIVDMASREGNAGRHA